MQVCTSLQTDNHASTPPLSFLQAGCPSCRPTNSVKALKAHFNFNNKLENDSRLESCSHDRALNDGLVLVLQYKRDGRKNPRISSMASAIPANKAGVKFSPVSQGFRSATWNLGLEMIRYWFGRTMLS